MPAQRSAAQRRSRRLDKTDAVDAVAAARALLAEPTLVPVQTLEVFDPLVAKITMTGTIEGRLRRLAQIDLEAVSTLSGEYRLSWLMPLIDQDRAARRQIRQLERELDRLLDEYGTTLRDESGIGPIAAATLLSGVGDPFRFARESKFARWCGTGAVALSSGEGDGRPVRHRLDYGGNGRFNSVLYIASVVQHRDLPDATTYVDRKLREGKTRREARRAHKRHLANRVIRRMWKDEQHRREHAINIAV